MMVVIRSFEWPENFVFDSGERFKFCQTIREILREVITDLDAEIDQLGDDFDYRGRLRNESWCDKLAHEVAATHKKLVDRGRLEAFEQLYSNQNVRQALTRAGNSASLHYQPSWVALS
ncbi:MAG: hypothetical protein U5P41_05440 [Gammaproteobacteria bacterium]|nr:hypothetical protein [Gammaproteobacteria bacterium]